MTKNIELKLVPGKPGIKAGSDGNIYSFWIIGANRSHYNYGVVQRILRPALIHGYPTVNVKDTTGKRRMRGIHILVCSAFNGAKPIDYEVSHLDGSRDNNIPDNLIWESRKANLARKFDHGTHDVGSNNSRAKLTDVQVSFILSSDLTGKELASMFKVSRSLITMVRKGKRYKLNQKDKEY